MSWEDSARADLEPKVAASRYVVVVSPENIDPKIALEVGYAVLLGKPIVVATWPGRPVPPGLRKVAVEVVELFSRLGTDAGTQELTARLAAIRVPEVV